MKKPLEQLTNGTFFTFPGQLGDLFIKTQDRMVRVPNTFLGSSIDWHLTTYKGNTNYIILTLEQVKNRLIQVGKPECPTCGQEIKE